ncbi:MAG: hypothetical protein Q9187_006184, partial [Circinaria calcarea]
FKKGDSGTTIGYATPANRCWIVDTNDHDRLVSIGGVGELLIEGRIIARSYLDDQTKTDAAFITNPAWQHDFPTGVFQLQRYDKTGDLVRYGLDGKIVLIGRKDSPVKLRGQRIELAEVEYYLQRYLPGVGEVPAGIITIPEAKERKALAAFICPGPEPQFISSEKTSTWKSQSEIAGPNSVKIFCSAEGYLHRERGEAETLLQHWRRILPVTLATVGADSNLFHMGGNSVDAIELVESLRSDGLYLTVEDVFRHPTLNTMSRMLRDWDLVAFKEAWNRVVSENSILRTRLIQTENHGWLQVVVHGKVEWDVLENVEAYRISALKTIMDFGDPLMRCGVISATGPNAARFIWTMHHSIYDGWSLPLILKSVQEVYQRNQMPKAGGFNRFIRYLLEIDRKLSEAYWLSQLADWGGSVFPRLPSTAYQPRPNSIERLDVHMPKNSTGLTASTIIRAAWSLILARYTAESDVVFGATVAGRSVPVQGIKDIIGPTISTVPVRIHVDYEQTVEAFLQEIHSTEMIAHEKFGLQNINRIGVGAVNACQFQNLLIIQPMVEQIGQSGLEQIAIYSTDYLTFALTLECNLVKDGISIEATFDDSVFDCRQIKRLLLQFEHVLYQIQAGFEDGRRLQDITVLSSADKEEVSKWNSHFPTVVDSCLRVLIQGRAKVSPDVPALCSLDGEMSYRELDALSSRFGHELAIRGVGPETFVPLCFEKSLWTVVAILAVMKAGGAFIHWIPRILWRDWPLTVSSSGPTSTVKPHNALYVTFTSGSTGKPKGAVVEHCSCVSGFQAQVDAGFFEENSRVFQFASYSFDSSIEQILATLLAGGTICIPSENERMGDLAGVMNRLAVNLADLTPSVASLLEPVEVPNLRVLRLSGENVPNTLIQKWAGRVRLENSYGPSECCVTSVANCQILLDTDRTNIGRSIGCLTWIVEPNEPMKLAPIGAVGELVLQGPIVGRGYINDAPATAAAFMEHASWLDFNGNFQSRLYRTGDLARYDSEGNVLFVGRKDTQVKLRGQRIELGEIECLLTTQVAGAASVAVVPRSGAYCDRIIAALQPRNLAGSTEDLNQYGVRLIPTELLSSADAEIAHLQLYLEKVLPNYMIPSAWAVVEQFPLLNSGKLDRKAIGQWISNIDQEERYPGITIRELARHIESTRNGVETNLTLEVGSTRLDFVQEVDGLRSQFLDSMTYQRHVTSSPRQSLQTIFLTGATGYLGTQILRDSLNRPGIGKVIAHVRAKTPEEGIQRLIRSAKAANWWLDKYAAQLEIWIGDLREPPLGLCGAALPDDCVNIIIHNGAGVNWYSDYATLKNANVLSVAYLLQAVKLSSSATKFVYISGGPQWDRDSEDDSEERFKAQLTDTNGYGQSKLVAERLVISPLRTSTIFENQLSIIKPGFVIGTSTEGFADVDDFIWRIVAGSISIRGYSEEIEASWIFVSSTNDFSGHVLGCLDQDQGSCQTVHKLLGGLLVRDFWSVITRTCGLGLQPLKHDEWLMRLRADVNEKGDRHPCYPILHMAEQGPEVLGARKPAALVDTGPDAKLVRAIERNVQYLSDLGFLPGKAQTQRPAKQEGIFQRRGRVSV